MAESKAVPLSEKVSGGRQELLDAPNIPEVCLDDDEKAQKASGGRQELLDALNNPEFCLDDDEKAQIKQWINSKQEMRVIVSGKTGSGKSSLLNGFVGLSVFPEGEDLEPTTLEVTKQELTKSGVKIVVFDCPGLQDGTDNEDKYLQDLQQKTEGRFDLMLYCVCMNEVRDDLLIHDSALRKLTEKMGKDIWKNAFVALTMGNLYQRRLKTKYPDITEEEMKTRFNAKVDEWKDKIQQALRDVGVDEQIVLNMPVHPAGYPRIPSLPGREYWLSSLWARMLIVVKPEVQHIPILIRSEEKAFKTVDQVTAEDFKKPIAQQPIIITPEVVKVVKSAGVISIKAKAGVKYGAAVGLAFGGVIGAAAGAAVGGTIGAVAGLCVKLFRGWKRSKDKK